MANKQESRNARRCRDSRRFSVFELFVYLTAVCIALGTLSVLSVVDVSWWSRPALAALSVGAIGALGSLMAVPVTLLAFGRRGVPGGAVLGALVVPQERALSTMGRDLIHCITMPFSEGSFSRWKSTTNVRTSCLAPSNQKTSTLSAISAPRF